ncbi:MAG: Uma2 family endonuclease [Armatimonadota bacterium]
MSVPAQAWISPEEYLERERASEWKHEYFDGEILARAGSSLAHNHLVVNLVAQIRPQLRGGKCRVYGLDMRLKVSPTVYTYPDLVIAPGDIAVEAEADDILIDPVVVIEVLSPTTEAYERGKKADEYRHMESLRALVLVEEERMRVECFTRGTEPNRWELTALVGPEARLRLEAIGCELTLAEIYEDVELPEKPVSPRPVVDL